MSGSLAVWLCLVWLCRVVLDGHAGYSKRTHLSVCYCFSVFFLVFHFLSLSLSLTFSVFPASLVDNCFIGQTNKEPAQCVMVHTPLLKWERLGK